MNTTRPRTIDTFPWDQAAEAEAYAQSIGATATPVPYTPAYGGSGGYIAIIHTNAEGLTLTRWNHGTLPTPGILVRHDSLLPGDLVYTGTELGTQTVSEVLYDGRTNGYLRYQDRGLTLHAAPADALIPLLERSSMAAMAA